MPTVKIPKLNLALEFAQGENLMQGLLRHQLPVASSCQGDGICLKCKMQILDGEENLSPLSQLEERHRREGKLTADERLSCQAKVMGDLTIRTGYW